LGVELAKQRASQGQSHRAAAERREMAEREYSLAPDSAEPDPNYRAVLDWVWSFSARPRTADEIVNQRAIKLERMRTLLHRLGDPHLAVPSLLVAGTKGKGSTVAMLAACLRADGRRTGRYTSPHLVNWRERIWVDGAPIATEQVVALADPIRAAVAALPADLGPLTTFEVGTAFAFLHFARENLEMSVLEVGVGGRYDATNVVEPLVSVITPISYDHTPTLGPTLTAIAEHKAGVLRAHRPGILGRQPPEARVEVERVAADVGARLEEIGRDWRWAPVGTDALRIEASRADVPPLTARVGLLGDHQRDNATSAVAALHGLATMTPALTVPPEAIAHGLAKVDWPGRLQVLQREPLLVLDGAHNAFSAEVLGRALEQNFAFDRLLVVLGLSLGKDAQGVVDALGWRADRLYVTRSHHERSADPGALAALAHQRVADLRITVRDDVGSAVEDALREARPNDLVLVTGSLFVVGEALVWWRRSPR
jgi:dihydrofolate synthase/folylpolyglutamate synthase